MKMPIREGKRSPCDGSISNKDGNLKVSKRKRDDPHNTDIPPAKKAEINVNFQKPLKVDDLLQKKLLEGMVVRGCVQEVRDTYLKINLPGQVLSYVPASNISEEFDAYVTISSSGEEKVSKDLTHMFKPGQHVITKIVEITKTGNGKLRVIVSLKPNLIYDDLSINDIRSGFIFSSSVQSIEDKGYKMNCGIPGVTAFLRKSQAANFEQIWNDGRLLEIGQVIRCLVTKFNKSEACLNIKLQADPETVANQVVEEMDVPVKSLFIGMHFKMTVSKITSSGLVVKFLENKTGYVHSNYLKTNFRTLNVGDVLLGRVLYIESLTEKIYLTALENVCGPFLPCPFKNIQKGKKFMEAKVVSSKEGNILLELEANSGIYGYVTKQYLNIDDEHKISEIVKERYPKGSFHACKVLGYDYVMQKYSCILRELKEIVKGDSSQKNSNSLKVGKPYIVYVHDVSPEGLIVQEQDSGIKGWIPLPQLTDYPPLAKVLCHTYRKGDELRTYCLSYANKVLFTASPTFIKYFQSLQGKELTKKGHSQLKENMVIPCTVTEITAAGIVVMIPMQGETCLVNVASDDICDGTVDVFSLGLEKYQSLMVQILQVSREGPSSGSSCFSRVTKGALMSESGLMLLQNYMNCQKKICNFWKSEGHPIGELCVGSQVKGTVVAISSLGAVINLDNGTQAVVLPTHYESLNIKKDMLVEGTVMFVDVVNKCVEISLEKEVQDTFASLGKLPDVGYNSKCYVLVSRPDIILCSITYNNAKNIVYVPSRWHINDLRPSPYFSVGERSKITIRMNDDHLIYAVPQKLEILEKNNENDCEIIMNDTNSIENNIQKINDISEFELGSEEKKEKKRKRKVKVMEEDTNGENACPESKIVESSNDLLLPDVNKSLMNGCENLTEYVKSETKDREKSRILNTHKLEENKKENKKKNKNLVKKNVQNDGCEPLVKENTSYLSVNAGFVWNATPDLLPVVAKQKTEDVSSSDEETEVTVNKKKKQRLTMAEKRELASQEEERLRKIEERLMNAEKNPVSADDFDRLVMSAPNDSKNWIKYMAYHLEATEVGKARAVAEQALKTISFREEQEKLNVWMALLNLENLYGTPESLDKTFEEAVKFNDSYKVHMQVLNMFSVTKKLEELDKLLQLITKKYKDQKNTWVEAGLACIKCGEIEKSRQLMQRALKVLNKRDHIEILTRFARMENEWGESERAETIMENILTSYTKRVDVWMMYIDMLIKSKKIDIARQVLDRAVIQKLPVMKMKALFKRYLQFEQIHGTPDKVQKVREMAKSYIENYVS